ncbi:MAG: hypothetical protein JNM30_09635 [Rhodospirillales bacterium]|nr:hypothetical protein [Rhodospirillales bacterium]
MAAAADTIQNYIRAKDENRPHLMARAFAPTAIVEMKVHASAISFPPSASGLDAISDMLVRQFGQTYENIYTFCLAPPPPKKCRNFSCDWLVGMSVKNDGTVRVGCGRYDWAFTLDGSGLVDKLVITIDVMATLDPPQLGLVLAWLTKLPYPWCTPAAVLKDVPTHQALSSLVDRLRKGT